VLGERIERNLYDLLEALIQSRYTHERQGLLGQANLTLQVLRFPSRPWPQMVRELQLAVCEGNGRFPNGGSITWPWEVAARARDGERGSPDQQVVPS
jgi:hypothetical protein